MDDNNNKQNETSLAEFAAHLTDKIDERKNATMEPIHYAANCYDIDLEAQMEADMEAAAKEAAEQAREEVRKKYASQHPARWNESKKDMAFRELAKRLSSDD